MGSVSTTSEGSPASPELSLFHGFELRCDDAFVPLPKSVQRLLAFLALQRRPQHRSLVAATLWMDTTDERAQANLRTALWRARQVDERLVTISGQYLAVGNQVHIDLAEMLDRVQRLETSGDIDADIVPDDFFDDLLPEWYEDWVLVERERLRQYRLHSLEVLCARLSDHGRHALAIQAGLAAVMAEPLRESAQRVLIEAHLAEGNVSEAVRCFDAFRTELHTHLGIEPSTTLRALVHPCR